MAVSTTDSRTYLPSTANNKSNLRNVEEVLKENEKLIKQGKHGTLCQILARECFFWKGGYGEMYSWRKIQLWITTTRTKSIETCYIESVPKVDGLSRAV